MKRLSFSEKFNVTLTIVFFIGILFLYENDYAQVNNPQKDFPQYEHIGLNVKTPDEIVDWYVKNMGFKIIKSGSEPEASRFICDPGGHVMFELYFKKEFPVIDFSIWDYMSFHIAFNVPDIYGFKENLIKAGATVAEEIKKTDSGDIVLMMRDPWGIPIQFVQRVKNMLIHKNAYLEHVAFNVNDSREVANWYSANMGMKIVRQGGEPNYGLFISDHSESALMELYQNKDFPFLNFSDVNFMSLHIAFSCGDPETVKNQLSSANAELLEGVSQSSSGDLILNMRDPWKLPIQFVKRAKK